MVESERTEEQCELTIKTPLNDTNDVVLVFLLFNFEQVSHIVLVFVSFPLNKTLRFKPLTQFVPPMHPVNSMLHYSTVFLQNNRDL